jgi:predicted nucleotidyltransferase
MIPSDPLDLLFGDYRRKLLGLLFARPNESFHVRELSRLTNIPVGSLHRELKQLSHAGLLLRQPSSNRIRYQANQASPMFTDLTSMLNKAASPSLIAENRSLKRLSKKYGVKKLSVFGSSARGDANMDSDIDFLVEFKRGKSPSLMGLEAFKRELSALYGGRAVDVATPSILKNPYRRKSIEKDLRVVYDT